MILKVTSRIARWGRLLFLPHFGCSRSHLPVRNNLLAILISAGLLSVSLTQHTHAMQMSSDTQVATAGYFQLHWSGKTDVFQLQESNTPDFKSFTVIYEGKDLARVVSGKADGNYFYRVATPDENNSLTSNTIKVIVSHHPIKNAIMFFIAGAIVFIAILALIIRGNRQDG